MKLPLSTTYVTFMVAMGTSLADRAWGLESAVYRVTGVLTVIGGWFFTALMAFSVALTFAFALYYFRWVAVAGLLLLVVFVVLRNLRIHRKREKAAKEMEVLDLKRVTDAEVAIRSCFDASGRYLEVVRHHLGDCFDGILTENRRQLKQLRDETSRLQSWSNIIVANIFKTLRLLGKEEADQAGKYSYVVYALQEISESMRDVILRCHVHTSNKHAGLLPEQRKSLQRVRTCVENLLADATRVLQGRDVFDYRRIAAHYVEVKQLLEVFDCEQITRIRSGLSKTRLSILFYGINNDCLKISQQTLQLVTIFDETFDLKPPQEA
jgi:Na+/phosphate symporter